MIDLTEHGDPIHAGMLYYKVVLSTQKLFVQQKTGEGHFYYTPMSSKGKKRRRELAEKLYKSGLR